MEFPPSCRTQLFCKLQTHFYSLAFHRLCLSWKHQGASPESVWQHPPPPYNFLPSEGWSREARRLCFYVAWRNQQSHAGNLPGVQRWEFEHLGEAAVECDQEHFVKYWNEVQLCGTFTSVFPFFSEAFNVRSRKMFDFLLHCIYFDTFRHFADRMLHQSQYSTVFNTFLLLPMKPSKKKSSQQRCQ